MRILLLGSGGREHAMAWKIAQSDRTEVLYIAPGNAGTGTIGENVVLDINNFPQIAAFVLEKAITMVVVGPEEPLVRGIYDYFKADNRLSSIPVIGPSQAAARLEGSKSFAKEFMVRHQIPTARYLSVSPETMEEGMRFLDSLQPPYVLKADGLALGKGVLILDDLVKAKETLQEMLGGMFGEASREVVIEEFLKGIECSLFVMTDGASYKILPEAKDYKRIGEGDKGLNTGGMGAISPVPFVDASFMQQVEERIIRPTVQGLQQDGLEYKGFIFIGLMVVQGEAKVIEYNCRMGDPETEVVMLRIKSDFVDLLEGVATGDLADRQLTIDPRAAAAVMLVSGGYPEAYEKGLVISGMENVSPEVLLFHAGTSMVDQQVVTSGGRVMAISAYGKDREEALRASFQAATTVTFEKKYFRKDIGFDL